MYQKKRFLFVCIKKKKDFWALSRSGKACLHDFYKAQAELQEAGGGIAVW